MTSSNPQMIEKIHALFYKELNLFFLIEITFCVRDENKV